MFEYHAWITIQHSAGDEDDADLNAAYLRAEEELLPLQGDPSLVNLRWINGMAQLHLSGFLNHRSGEGQNVIDAFYRIGAVAQGSYGVLYMLDDEDQGGKNNEFQVLVMRRGQVTQEEDHFFSPYIPLIEDEEE